MRYEKHMQLFLFVLFALGGTIGLTDHYSLFRAVLGGLLAAIAMYIVPLAIVRSIGDNKPAVVFATLWEFACAIVTKAIDFPLWSIFLMAGVGGVAVLLFLALRENVSWIPE